MRRSAGVSNLSSQSLILGQSPFGKLTNIVFPNLVTKRLGKRGNSKYNYVGITWDTAMVGEEILELLEHELPQIRDHFNKNSQSRDSDKHTDIVQPRKANIPTLVENNLAVSPLTTWKKPSHTFVDLSHKFPRINCSPRIWETTPNTVPRQSTWAQDHMERSLAALKLYHINLEPLIHNFNAGNFSDDHNDSLSNSVFRALVILHSASAPQKAYLHLYLIILVMIFPVVLASNTEVYPPAKTQFQYSVQSCIAKLESESANLFGVDETTLSTFIWILRKMVNVNDMTSCVIQAQYTEKILNEMTVQLEIALTKPPDEFADRSPLESLYIKSIITSMNSYNFQFAEDSSTASENNMIDSIDSLARLFKNTALKSKGEMSVLPQEARSQGLKHVSQDVPYQVFKIALRNFHEVTLTKPLILNLPMAVFTCIIHNFTNWVQCTSLNDFQKGDTEFAKECFKCCWVFSSMHHEYMRLISEVVALGETLSRNTDSE
ncbi:hypothetical protein JCM33374_g1307 [Metschnikowia sp. JCM 33374]|nr:hypothetical protein JCM33374_g1307 [Metschnikowia sp. JCM 33374]